MIRSSVGSVTSHRCCTRARKEHALTRATARAGGGVAGDDSRCIRRSPVGGYGTSALGMRLSSTCLQVVHPFALWLRGPLRNFYPIGTICLSRLWAPRIGSGDTHERQPAATCCRPSPTSELQAFPTFREATQLTGQPVSPLCLCPQNASSRQTVWNIRYIAPCGGEAQRRATERDHR